MQHKRLTRIDFYACPSHFPSSASPHWTTDSKTIQTLHASAAAPVKQRRNPYPIAHEYFRLFDDGHVHSHPHVVLSRIHLQISTAHHVLPSILFKCALELLQRPRLLIRQHIHPSQHFATLRMVLLSHRPQPRHDVLCRRQTMRQVILLLDRDVVHVEWGAEVA